MVAAADELGEATKGNRVRSPVGRFINADQSRESASADASSSWVTGRGHANDWAGLVYWSSGSRGVERVEKSEAGVVVGAPEEGVVVSVEEDGNSGQLASAEIKAESDAEVEAGKTNAEESKQRSPVPSAQAKRSPGSVWRD